MASKMKDYHLLVIITIISDYEMCCFKRKMSAPKRPIHSKAWRLLSFLLEYYHQNESTRQNHEEKHESKE